MGKADGGRRITGGRVTYLKPAEFRYREAWRHEHRLVSKDAWAQLERPLGRRLTVPERWRIVRILNGGLAAVAPVRAVTRQDQRQTLQALSRLAPDDAARAFLRVDGWTEAAVCAAIRFDPGFSDEDRRQWVHPRPDLIPVAAARALARLPRASDGPRVKHHRRVAVRLAVAFWLDDLRLPRRSRRPRGECSGTGRLGEWVHAFLVMLYPEWEPDAREVARMVAEHLRHSGGS